MLLLTKPATAQVVTEYATVDSLKVGDTFSYVIVLNKDRLYDDIQYPDSTLFGSSFEIRSLQRYQVTDFKDSLVYRLQFFGSGDTTVGELPIHLVRNTDTSTVYTKAVPIHFESTIQGKQENFRPLKPIFDFAAQWWPYALALLLLGVAGWYLYRLYRQKVEESQEKEQAVFTPTPFRNPLDRLENRLDGLNAIRPDSKEAFKEFYVELGDAIREYFENLYRIPALESTSREILYELNRRAVDEELVKKTRDVLREADMVKFANFTPTQSQADTALEKADAFLDRAREIDRERIERLRKKHEREDEQRRAAFNSEQKQSGERE